PARPLRQPAAQERAGNRRDGENRPHDSHVLTALTGGDDVRNDGLRQQHQPATTQALNATPRDEPPNILRHAAGDCANHKQHDGRHEQRFSSDLVADASIDGHHDCRGQNIGGNNPRHDVDAVEFTHNRWQGRGQHGLVQGSQQHSQHQPDKQQSDLAAGSGMSRCWSLGHQIINITFHCGRRSLVLYQQRPVQGLSGHFYGSEIMRRTVANDSSRTDSSGSSEVDNSHPRTAARSIAVTTAARVWSLLDGSSRFLRWAIALAISCSNSPKRRCIMRHNSGWAWSRGRSWTTSLRDSIETWVYSSISSRKSVNRSLSLLMKRSRAASLRGGGPGRTASAFVAK